MDLKPLVSVIVPCYNLGNYVSECINSVLAQTYSNWECIIVNDGSTDNTEDISLQIATRDDRIKYYKKENGGLSSTRNFGIQQAKGQYILPLDVDDIIDKNYLEQAVKAFNLNAALKLVYCEAEFFGEKSGRWVLQDFNLKDLARTNMIFCTAMFKKEDWIRVNGYDENMKFGWEDWEFWISILKNGGEVKRLPLVGFFYRIRPTSMLRSMSQEEADFLCDYVYQKHFEFIKTQLGNPIQIANQIHYYIAEWQKSQIALEKNVTALQETQATLQQTQATLEQTQAALEKITTEQQETQKQLHMTQTVLEKIKNNRYVRFLKKLGIHVDR